MSDFFSIVIPVYNSNEILLTLCEQIFKVLPKNEVQIIFVDDGSESSTWEQVKEIRNHFNDCNIKGIRLSKNYGQHNATICGLDYCSNQFVVTLDDDLQFSPEDIPLLIKKLKEDSFDVVYGLPAIKRQSFLRRGSFYLLSFLFSFFGEKIDKTSSFRVMRKSLTDKLKLHRQYFVLIDVTAKLYTNKIGFCNIKHRKREVSKSGYSNMNLVRMVARAVIAYSAVPLKLFLYLLITTVTISIFSGLEYYFKPQVFQAHLPVLLGLSLGVFIMAFVILFAYLFHITNLISNKPCYHIAEEL